MAPDSTTWPLGTSLCVYDVPLLIMNSMPPLSVTVPLDAAESVSSVMPRPNVVPSVERAMLPPVELMLEKVTDWLPTWERSIDPGADAVTVSAVRVSVMPPADVVADTAPASTVPASPIAPPAVMARSPLIVELPMVIAPVSLSVTSLPLVMLTAPPKLLAVFSVMSLAEPAERLVVPVTLIAVLSVIAPLAVTVRLPAIW